MNADASKANGAAPEHRAQGGDASAGDRCEHLREARVVAPTSRGCEACRALGTGWNELRVCTTCGHVGCCEDSPHAHALRHHRDTGHPIIIPLDRRESWAWCYVHNRYFQGAADALRPRRTGIVESLRRWFAPRGTRK